MKFFIVITFLAISPSPTVWPIKAACTADYRRASTEDPTEKHCKPSGITADLEHRLYKPLVGGGHDTDYTM